MKTTRWRPDTCGCDISYDWDETVAASARTHAGSTIHAVCTAHAGASDPVAHLVVINDENTRKNRGLKHLMDQAELGEEVVIDGQTVLQFKSGITVSWVYDDSRILTVTIDGANITAGRQNQIQSAADSLFGVGKVVLVWT